MAMDYAKKLEELKKKSSRGVKTDYFTFEDGDNLVRIVPAHPNMEGFFVEVMQHSNGYGKGSVKIICVDQGDWKNLGNCLICEELVNTYGESTDKADIKKFKDEMPKSRYFFNVLDRADDDKQKVAEGGIMLLKEILTLIADPDYEDMLDPLVGIDVVIKKSGKSTDTEYKVVAKRKPTPMFADKAEVTKFIGTSAEDTQISDLNELLNQFAEEPEKALLVWHKGWAALKDDAAEETETKTEKAKTPAKQLEKKATKPAPVVEADEDEGEAEDVPEYDFSRPLKARDPITGNKRFKQADGTVVTADGTLSPKGLEEGARPSKPSKAYLKEFPAPVEEEEEEEEVEATPPPKKVAKPVKQVVADDADDDDENLEDLEAIIAANTKKKK